ncbi:MAG: DUF4357 domain-containing protein [Candidatus Brocadiia bacterium]
MAPSQDHTALILLISQTDQAILDVRPPVSESVAQANQGAVAQLTDLLPVLGKLRTDIANLEAAIIQARVAAGFGSPDTTKTNPVILTMRFKDLVATVICGQGFFDLQPGSRVRMKSLLELPSQIAEMKEEALALGKLEYYRLDKYNVTSPIRFSSLSIAASFVAGRPLSGEGRWVDESKD